MGRQCGRWCDQHHHPETEETLGVLVTGGGGTYAQGFGTVQYGGKIKKETTYRVFTKYFNNDHYPNLNGQDGDDGWHLLHGGFRVDTILSKKDTLTMEGDIYTGSEGAVIVHSTFTPPDNMEMQRLATPSGEMFWAGGATQSQAGGTRRCSFISTEPNEMALSPTRSPTRLTSIFRAT
jgi:hypothetical protein